MSKLIAFLEEAVAADTDLCIEWPFSIAQNGYGKAKLNGINGAHRISYLIANGDFDRSMYVLHRCDNRKCVNPKHLFLGTQADNMKDMSIKGRLVLPNNAGERHAKARLTNESVLEMRSLHTDRRLSIAKIARDFGVAWRTAYDVINRISWKHV